MSTDGKFKIEQSAVIDGYTAAILAHNFDDGKVELVTVLGLIC